MHSEQSEHVLGGLLGFMKGKGIEGMAYNQRLWLMASGEIGSTSIRKRHKV